MHSPYTASGFGAHDPHAECITQAMEWESPETELVFRFT